MIRLNVRRVLLYHAAQLGEPVGTWRCSVAGSESIYSGRSKQEAIGACVLFALCSSIDVEELPEEDRRPAKGVTP